MSIFDRWRAWDVVPDQKIPVMVAIFGHDVAPDGSIVAAKALELDLVVGGLSLALNPGHGESSIVSNGLETAIAFDPVFLSPNHPPRAKRLVVQAYMADFAVNLNWDLIELAGNVVQAAEGSIIAARAREEQLPTTKAVRPGDESLSLELVVGNRPRFHISTFRKPRRQAWCRSSEMFCIDRSIPRRAIFDRLHSRLKYSYGSV